MYHTVVAVPQCQEHIEHLIGHCCGNIGDEALAPTRLLIFSHTPSFAKVCINTARQAPVTLLLSASWHAHIAASGT